jgi:Ca-activated chloride channel family protein
MASELAIQCKLARDYTLESISDTLAYLLLKVVPSSSLDLGSLPLNMSIVIDVSRSMKGQKLRSAIEATKLLARSLRAGDWVSVTTFSGEAKVVVPATEVSDKSSILSAIDEIKIVGSTRMYQGMDVGAREMRQAGLSNKVNRMILLTDGETEGEEQCRIIARQERENNITISTLGIGKRYNEVLLSEISDTTLGYFFHLKTPEQINEIFQKELGNASASVISDVNLNLNLAEDVRLDSLDRVFPSNVKLQPVSEAEGRVFKVGIGNLKKDEPTVLGAQLRLPSKSAGRVRIAQVSIVYSIPGLQITDRVEQEDVMVEYTADRELCGQVDREVISYFNQLSAQKLIEQAIEETRAGNIEEAAESLSQAQAITEKLGNLPLTDSIEEALNELERKGVISEEGVKTIKAGSRQTVRIDESELE